MMYCETTPLCRTICGTAATIIAVLAVAALIFSWVMHMRKRYVVLSAAVFLYVMFILQGLTDVSNHLEYNRSFSFFSRTIGYMPCKAVYALLLSAVAVEILQAVLILRRDKNLITSWTIKESLDDLPDGLCVYASDGTPILVNRKMNSISSELFSKTVLNGEKFYTRLKNKDLKDKEKILRTEPHVILETKDGTVWEMQPHKIAVGEHTLNEIIACDITNQYALHRSLMANNERLAKINERLRQYSKEVERITTEKEILNAKIQVHDDVGRALLAFRSYLAKPVEKRDRKKLIFIWRYTLSVLKKESEPRRTGSDFGALLKAADAVGVKVVLYGKMPKNEDTRQIITSALHECLTNTVKHAGGDAVYLRIDETEKKITARITNNGKPPEEEITESGGLKNLRARAEEGGAVMRIESQPRFALILEFDKWEEL